MILRQASGQFYMELNADEALNLIAQLAQTLEVAGRYSFPQHIVLPITYTEGYNKQHYANVIHFRVEVKAHEPR